jgi:hypothetical protein
MADPKLSANSIEGKTLHYVERAETIDASIKELQDSIAEEVKSLREDRKELIKEADQHGVSADTIKLTIKRRALNRKAAEKLSIDELSVYRTLADQLPGLGEAAAKAKGYA